MSGKTDDLEMTCKNNLEKRFGKYAYFKKRGGSDSTESDILVTPKNGGSPFYIEVKCSDNGGAQSGQFVAFPNEETRHFEFSDKDKSKENKYVEMILEYMAEHFERYLRVVTDDDTGKSGEWIDMPNGEEIFRGWIKKYYKEEKNAIFFMTNKKGTDDLLIFPIENMQGYCNVTAKYRIKRSGSGEPAKKNMESLIGFIDSNNYGVMSTSIEKDGKKTRLFVVSSMKLNNQKFAYEKTMYMFSRRGNRYEVRRLSNTDNPNVIFQWVLKDKLQAPSWTDEQFIEFLQLKK